MDRKLKILLMTVLMVMLSAVVLAQDLPVAHGGFNIQVLAEKEAAELPEGPLFWRIENFPTLEAAEAAAGPWSLVAEAAGKVWLFTLGPEGESSPGGTLVAEVGPLPEVVATEYLLRINETVSPPDGSTTVHTHPGTEGFYVLVGEVSTRMPGEVLRVSAGRYAAGPPGGTIKQVYNSGADHLHMFVMFVVDANQPFAPPAEFPNNH